MDSRVRSLNRHLVKYDKDLFVRRDGRGTIHLYRMKPLVVWHKFEGISLGAAINSEQYIMSLTHNWKETGRPADWGVLPFMARVQEIDGWNQGDEYDEFCKRRIRTEEDRKRINRNDFKARATDLRRDFARATNDLRMGGEKPF